MVDDQIYRNLIDLLGIDDVSVLYLDLSVTEDHLGTTSVDLIEGGRDINVDNNNCAQYLEEQLKYRLMNRIKSQLLEFLEAFMMLCRSLPLRVRLSRT